jgi:hypothetical protein
VDWCEINDRSDERGRGVAREYCGNHPYNGHISVTLRVIISAYKPPMQWGTGGSFTVLNRPRPEADMLAEWSVEVKNEWSYTYIPPCAFMGCTGTILTRAFNKDP